MTFDEWLASAKFFGETQHKLRAAWAAALEEAAKICEREAEGADSSEYGEGKRHACEHAAEAIRALTKA